jgi:hypothetical protein
MKKKKIITSIKELERKMNIILGTDPLPQQNEIDIARSQYENIQNEIKRIDASLDWCDKNGYGWGHRYLKKEPIINLESILYTYRKVLSRQQIEIKNKFNCL